MVVNATYTRSCPYSNSTCESTSALVMHYMPNYIVCMNNHILYIAHSQGLTNGLSGRDYALVGGEVSIRDMYTCAIHESVPTDRILSSTGLLSVQ